MFVYTFDKLNATTEDILSEIERIPCKTAKLEETRVSWFASNVSNGAIFLRFIRLHLIQFFRTYENTLTRQRKFVFVNQLSLGSHREPS